MKKIIFLLILLSTSIASYGGTVLLSWTIPEMRENGNVLPIEELSHYTIKYSCDNSDDIFIDVALANTSSLALNVIGDCAFSIKSTDTNQLESKWSNTINLDVLEMPNPIAKPELTRVVESVTIYWDLPLLREDGSALVPENITSFIVAYSCNNSAEVQKTVLGNMASTTIVDLFGDCLFKVKALDSNGLNSPWSDDYSLLIKLRTPTGGGFR